MKEKDEVGVGGCGMQVTTKDNDDDLANYVRFFCWLTC